LAWWRTGLTALAVALAVGRVIPGLDHSSADWLYGVAGVCFALYGVAVIGYGSLRRVAVDRALAAGRFPDPPRHAHAILALSGVALGLLTVLIIVVS
jgi:uncharacterized membrane protein YidH (DUF202 family)